MNASSKSRKVGPLFAEGTIVQSEPEKIWDENNDNPAAEEGWLAYFSQNRAELSAAEVAFITEYDRRRKNVG
jgi:hypothetical protein